MRVFWREIRVDSFSIPSLSTGKIKAVVFCFVLFYTCFFGLPLALHGEKLCTRLLAQKTEIRSYYWRFLRCMSESSPKEFFRRSIGTSHSVVTFIGDERHYWRFKALQSAFDKHTEKHAAPKMCFYRKDYLNSAFVSQIKMWTTSKSLVSGDRISKAGENCINTLPTHLVLGFSLTPCRADDRRNDADSSAEIQKNFATVLQHLTNVRLILVQQDCSDNWCQCKNRSSMARGRHLHNPEDIQTLKSLKNISFFRASRSIAYAHGLQHEKSECDDGWNSTPNTSFAYKAATLDGILLPYVLFDIGSECCAFVPNLTVIQKRLFILFLSATLLAVVFRILSLCFRSKAPCVCVCTSISEDENSHGRYGPSYFTLPLEFFTLVSKFGLILLYLFFRNLTKVYEKKSSGCSFWEFMIPLLLFLMAGIVSIRPSKTNTFNNVDITREWKGWMQLCIVRYHHGCNSQMIPFVVSRITVSAYLFLSGYGHFYYYWRRKPVNYAISGLLKLQGRDIRKFGRLLLQETERYLTVMFRLNLVVIALCLTLDDKPHHYYYMQLATVWYTALTVIMICYPRVSLHGLQNQVASEMNESSVQFSRKAPSESITSDLGNHEQNIISADTPNRLEQSVEHITAVFERQRRQRVIYAVFLGKLVFLAFVADFICQNPAIFDKIFFSGPMQDYFNSDTKHWRWRFNNDAYTVVYGAVFALACEMYFESRSKQTTLSAEGRCLSATYGRSSPFLNMIRTMVLKIRKRRIIPIVVTGLGCVALTLSLKVYFQCTDFTCVHNLNKYFCIAPILSYVALRNGLPFFRNHCSRFFVRLGCISMEIYLFHQLKFEARLIQYFPVHVAFNSAIEALILFCMCDEMHQVTASLDKYFVPKRASEFLWKIPMALLIYYFLTMEI